MRLIDADERIRELKEHISKEENADVKEVYEGFIHYLEQCPTAYDVDEVTEQIEKLNWRKNTPYLNQRELGMKEAYDNALYIVGDGYVENLPSMEQIPDRED